MTEVATPDQLDAGFVPRIRKNVAAQVIDDEVLVLDEDTGQSILLNGTGALVWQCFDGTSSIDEICADLAEAYGAPRDQVTQDVLALVMQLGWMRMLEDVEPPPPPPPPLIHEPGTQLSVEPRPGLDDKEHSLAELGRPAVLINWRDSCGWCQKLLPDLVAQHPQLRERGIALGLVVHGDVASNLALLEEHGLDPDITLMSPQASDDPVFDRHGTPVAYAIDAQGVVTSPIAQGANQVPALIAGLIDDEPGS